MITIIKRRGGEAVSEQSEELRREKVRVIPIGQIDDFPEHPFLVKDDENMEQLIRSIELNGVLNPLIARKKEGERFELISGHRRKHACEKLGVEQIPVIVRDLSRDEAIIEMVDSNLQREHILPSEKARAFKMKMDAMRRQGKRTDLTSSPLGTKLRTDEIVAQEAGESRNQVQRYVRLNELTPELLEFVDEGKIGMRPAVELSYLQEEEMRDLVDYIDTEGTFPSHAQTIRMRELSREGRLDTDTINEIMGEAKGNQKVRIKIPLERIQRYFPDGTTEKQMEDMIVKALAMYRQRQREDRDAR
ncbi:MAG: ParB/RepB/Spo0J family partition protein [Ruminococcaceae bacterium]|nr:ParB/RepB/Spo0J family partition protein [Oscillospiraceae bacterium]